MPWTQWFSSKPAPAPDDTQKATPVPAATGTWENGLNRTDWSHYTSAQTITMSLITTAATLGLIRVYKTYLRRIPSVEYLKPGLFHRRSLFGYVTRVGDGDNFHFYHTPGGRWMGWGWIPGRKPAELKKFKNLTLHVRIAGVDAPELAHFGKKEQPYGREAIEWLRGFVLHRSVRVYPYRKDQYGRVVCSVKRRTWGGLARADVGLSMIKQGLATVYEAKFGSEFGNMEEQYRAAEARAKEKHLGMWSSRPGLMGKLLGQKVKEVETPRQYKTRTAKEEAEHHNAK